MLAQNLKEENSSVVGQIHEFISSPILYLTCTQKFKPDVMLNFFRPLGALTVTGRKKEPVVNSAEIAFDSCLNAEKAFAIWHCRYTVPFQGRLFFSRNADPAFRETEPNSPRIQAEGFPIDISEFEIFDFFRPMGPIFSCLIEHSKKAEKPTVIIHYAKSESVSSALEKINNTIYRGEKIIIQALSEQNALAFQSKPSPPAAIEVYRISVKGFPITSEISFRDFFLKAGVILNCQFDQNTGSGSVEYETALGAFNATSKFNNFKLKDSILVVKNTGEDNSPKPHAIIPLYSNNETKNENIEAPIPTSRKASQSRWSQVSKDKSFQEATKRKHNDGFEFNGDAENLNTLSFQNPNNLAKNAPNSNTKPTTYNTNRKQPEASYLANTTKETKTVDSVNSASSSASKASPQEFFPLKKIENKNESKHKLAQPSSLPIDERAENNAQNTTGAAFQKSWEEFKKDKSYGIISNIAKSLSPAANPIQEKMLETVFTSNPELVIKLAHLAADFSDKLTVEENKFKATHEFYLSSDAYHAMLRSCHESELEVNMCNPEYFPLYPSKETYLKQLMSLPIEQSRPIMASMIEKRLKELEVPDHFKVSIELTQKCSLRLLMVSYYYDDVLVDLLQKNFPNLGFVRTQ